jgi:preprotein translocase subunit SecD
MKKRDLIWKTVLIVAIVLVCLLGITGLPHGFSWSAIKASAAERIHLGLDLQGGTHMILQVHTDDAVNVVTDQAVQHLQEALAKNGMASVTVTKPDPKTQPDVIQVTGVDPRRSDDFRSLVANELGTSYTVASLPGQSGGYQITLTPAADADVRQRALDQSIETIARRVNFLGVTEPTVQQHGLGQYQILVQLPGISDPDRVRQVLQETAMLEFRLGKGGPFPSQADALAQYGGVLPPDTVLLPGQSIGASGGPAWYLVSRTDAITGNDLRDAEPNMDPQRGGWVVTFSLTRDAGQRFGTFTSANIGKPLVVVLDNKVQESAIIHDRIEDSGQIEGRFTAEQAKDLALVLRSGALPASLSIIGEDVVGPSLGADSIHDGILAALLGFFLVAVFMLVYYRGAGINAVLALVLNLILLMAYMTYVDATLTLPGIAGIILTIGMAVDSNVLIFERVREELRHGKPTGAAIENGFGHAFRTILDTHVTTVVSAIFLFLFGTGPIKGFAVTLTAGLIANLFTAVFVSRVIFDWELSRRPRGAAISI